MLTALNLRFTGLAHNDPRSQWFQDSTVAALIVELGLPVELVIAFPAVAVFDRPWVSYSFGILGSSTMYL